MPRQARYNLLITFANGANCGDALAPLTAHVIGLIAERICKAPSNNLLAFDKTT